VRSLGLSLVSFVIAFLLATSGLAQGQTKRRPYLEGQFWQFKLREWDAASYDSARLVSGIYEISYSQNQLKAFYVKPGEEREELNPVPPLLMRLLGRGRDFRFPLTVGKKWSYEYTERITLPIPCSPCFHFLRRAVEINVEGLENVTTEAGTFEAFKLVKEDGPKTSWRRWVTTYSFSRVTGSVVKMFLDVSGDTGIGRKREIELIKYGAVSGVPPLVAAPDVDPMVGEGN